MSLKNFEPFQHHCGCWAFWNDELHEFATEHICDGSQSREDHRRAVKRSREESAERLNMPLNGTREFRIMR